MPLSTSTNFPYSDKDDERPAASTTERETNSSDMEIEDEDDDDKPFRVNDASNTMESTRHDGLLGANASISGKFETRIPSRNLYVGEEGANFKISSFPNEPLATQKEDPRTNFEGFKYPISGKQPAKDKAAHEYVVGGKAAQGILERKAPEDHHKLHCSSKSHLVVNEIMDESSNQSSVAVKEVAINEIVSIPVRYQLAVNGLGFEENSERMEVQTEGNKRKIITRFYGSAVPQTSTGTLSPDVEFSSGYKRPALICDFFARGWCIRGSSCTFLHIKKSRNKPKQQPEEDVADADGTRAVQLDEGFKNAAGRSISPCSTDVLPLSDENKTAISSQIISERTPPSGPEENQIAHPVHQINKFSLLQSKDIPMGTSHASQQFSVSTDDLGSKDVRHNGIDKNLPVSLNDRSNCTFRNGCLPEYISSVSGSVKSLGNVYRENQSYRLSMWLSSLPFDSSLTPCSFGDQKVSDNDRERHTSSSELESDPLNAIAGDPLYLAEYRINTSSNDWEPSVPFQPSFFVTFGTPSPHSHYDSLRDSTDLSNVRERALKFSFSSQGPNALNIAIPPTYGNPTSAGLVGPECNGDNRAVSSHDKYHENVVNNNCYTSGIESLTTIANDGTSAADMHNETLAKEENSSVASHVKDISRANIIDTDHDNSHWKDGSRCKKAIKVERVREKNEMYVEHKAEGDVLKETKTMKHFHAALVIQIKELLKPTWLEGHISKDAHNKIVKKAVDKVLGAIQHHQIPATFESAKQYLSLSQPKIARLVEGYVGKYGKS